MAGIPEKYKNKIAWSNYLKTYIKVVSYWTKNNWWFVRCDKRGVYKGSKAMKARSKINVFEWQEIE